MVNILGVITSVKGHELEICVDSYVNHKKENFTAKCSFPEHPRFDKVITFCNIGKLVSIIGAASEMSGTLAVEIIDFSFVKEEKPSSPSKISARRNRRTHEHVSKTSRAETRGPHPNRCLCQLAAEDYALWPQEKKNRIANVMSPVLSEARAFIHAQNETWLRQMERTYVEDIYFWRLYCFLSVV